MTFWETLLLAVALSMDAVAVSVANSLAYRCKAREMAAMPLLFGGFQGLMPLLGYWVGGLFADLVHRYAGIVTLVVLGYIGAKMLFDGLRGESGDGAVGMLTWRVLLFQAIATSIDAFAVGVSLLAMDVRVVPACATIAVTTFLCSLLALFLGRRFGTALGEKAKAAGGLILLAIAIKAIL